MSPGLNQLRNHIKCRSVFMLNNFTHKRLPAILKISLCLVLSTLSPRRTLLQIVWLLDQIKSLQIARFMGPTWVHLGPVGPRWAPCWPHKPCYQGCLYQCICHRLIPFLSYMCSIVCFLKCLDIIKLSMMWFNIVSDRLHSISHSAWYILNSISHYPSVYSVVRFNI